MGTKETPADIESRGSHADQLPAKWLDWPEWLSNPDEWPTEVAVEETEETESEAKQTREIFKAETQDESNNFFKILVKHIFWKTIRVTAWIARFVHNARPDKAHRRHGPLITIHIQEQIGWWLKEEQTRFEDSEQMRKEFKEDSWKDSRKLPSVHSISVNLSRKT